MSDDKNDTVEAAKAFISKGVDSAARGLLAPLTAVGAIGEATGLTKKNPFTLEGVLGSEAAPTGRQADEQQALEAAHPIATGAGAIAGSIAGSLPTAALGGGVARLVGGGFAGAAVGGAAEGATYGLASAADQAEHDRQQLDGQHALAAAGLGALLGGSLRLGGEAAGRVFGAGAGALDSFADEAPYKVAGAISEHAPAIAEKATKLGLKGAGLTHGLAGYLFGEAAGDAVAPKVADVIARNSGAIGAIAQRGAKAAAQTIDAVTTGASAVRPAVAPTAMSVFLGKEKEPERAYESRVDELNRLASDNGAGIRDAIADSLGPVAARQPGAVLGMTQAATNGVKYLLSKLSGGGVNTKSLTPVTDTFVPPRADISTFARVYAAVMKPATVLADIRRGTVTSDQLDAVRTVYPDWYQNNVIAVYGQKLVQRDAKGQRLSYDQQRIANLVLGTNTGLDSVDLALTVGPAFTKQSKQQGSPNRSSGGGSNQQPMTPTDAILGSGR